MSPELDELLKRAMALPPEDRAAMANSLLESLDETEDEDAEDAWDDEIKRRVDDVRSGRVKAIPGEQVLARLNARRRDAKA
jgi:putative addiction module component (TIGR02574 family)